MEITVWFSCGAASAVAAKKTIELYPDARVRVVNSPIAEEHEDNQRFLKDVEAWLGLPIEVAVNSKFPNQSCVEVWDKRSFMSGPLGAPCTVELKKKARQEWEASNPSDYMVLGFTFEEKGRAERFKLTERENLLTPLIDLKYDKFMCFEEIRKAGLKLPEIYKLGYPNANCIGCVKATSPTYWNHVRLMHPEVFRERAEQSSRVGAKLVRVRGERIFLKDLDPADGGESLRSMQFECGLFCEEK